MSCLSLKDILQKTDLPTHEVHVEHLGGSVRVRELRADERGELEKRFWGKKPGEHPGDFRESLCELCCIDDKGEHLFDKSTIKTFMKLPAKAVQIVVDKLLEINGFTESDVETLEKN